ncbi:hypothetical protein NIES4074_26850 [Cylindrospermum sp. NIES-4074]|nr:hypothetical protein NIES4074_26850 [Cylindrospermum sp. NIES-4074]
MNYIKKILQIAAFPISLGLSLIAPLRGLTQAEPQMNLAPLPEVNNSKISQNFIPPNRGTPNTTAGGASRGSCDEKLNKGKKLITPLIPQDNLGLTFSERPTFYWFLRRITAQNADFSLIDAKGKAVYRTSFILPRKPGIIGFTLPVKAPELKVGERYHWYMGISCGLKDIEDKLIVVEGWVERIDPTPDLLQKLKNTNPNKISEVYAKSGIWHEAVNTLVQQRCISPKDKTVLGNWKALLESVGLKNVVSEPLVNSCTDKVK